MHYRPRAYHRCSRCRKGQPAARRERKARDLDRETARPPAQEKTAAIEGAPHHPPKEPSMSRLQVLINRPRRTLAALATVLVAAGITVASGASFTAASASPGNVFAAGTLSIASSKDNAAIMNIGAMRPGDPASTGVVDVQNTGSLGGAFTLAQSHLTDSDAANPLSGKLNVVVNDCGP